MKKRILRFRMTAMAVVIGLLIGIAGKLYAYDFSAVCSTGQTLYYTIISPTAVKCIGPAGETMFTWSGYSAPTGALIIPSSVTQSGTTYTVKSIATYAFSNCTGLTSITIPSSVNRIGGWAFYNTINLNTINLPNTGILFESQVIQCTGWYENQPNGLVYLGNTLVGYKGNVPANYSLVVPSNIKNIAGNAFNAYSGHGNNVISVSFPSSLEYIGDYAFCDCQITSLTLPNSLKGIGHGAFGSNLISSLTIPSNVEYIGQGAFSDCGLLTTVNYNPVNADIEGTNMISIFFNCPHFSTLHIGSSVQRIPAYLFSNCTHISGNLDLPNSLQFIDGGAFQGCTGITGNLDINNFVQVIGQMAFYGCTGITTTTLGTNIDSIGSNAFANMTGLVAVTYNSIHCKSAESAFYNSNFSTFLIGNNVKYIPDNLLINNINLSSVTFPNTLTRIGKMNFYGCGLQGVLSLPASLDSVGYGAFNMNPGITSIEVKAVVPPLIESYYGNAFAFFNGSNWDTPIYVPCESINSYQTAPGWSYFNNILCNDPTSIDDKVIDVPQIYVRNREIIIGEMNGQPVVITGIDGRTITSIANTDYQTIVKVPSSGVYIVRVGPYSVRKVVVQ